MPALQDPLVFPKTAFPYLDSSGFESYSSGAQRLYGLIR